MSKNTYELEYTPDFEAYWASDNGQSIREFGPGDLKFAACLAWMDGMNRGLDMATERIVRDKMDVVTNGVIEDIRAIESSPTGDV